MIYACQLADLATGTAVRIDVEPPIAVFRTADDGIYALDDTCSHQEASLAEGWLEDCSVVCPLHEAEFDLRTGQATCRPARRPVRTHGVVIQNDAVHVVLSSAEPNLPPRRATRLTS